VRPRALAAVALALVAALAGCGLGPGKERAGGVELRVTRDFGRAQIAAKRVPRVREEETVMRLLRSRFDVATRYGGRFVQSIDGLSGTGGGGRRDWFFYVNGVESGVGAAEYQLSPGDVVQWDYRRWDAAMRVPAIVGAYPEPFVHGRDGHRLPVRVECADPGARACTVVQDRLRRIGARPSVGSLGAPGGRGLIRVVVAPWSRARIVAAASALPSGPARSGVFARFDDGGRRLELLDEAGHLARSEGQGAGLLAAFAPSDDQLAWLVTGTDDAGVAAAAGALDPGRLRNAFAVAAQAGGPVERLPLPVGEGRAG
jgi:hypothetical protein